jgi:RNA polymerase sigma-70 factor (ECF subfamily)
MNTIPTELLNQLYAEKHRELYIYSNRIVKDDQLANDVVQECFIRLHKQDYEKWKDRLIPWLFTVCRNMSIKFLNKKNRFVEIFETDYDKIDESRSASEQMDLEYQKKLLKKYMRKLTKRQRDVLKLRFFKDLDYNQCAKKLKTSSGNIGFQQCTAIQNLRKLMSKHIHD